MKSKLPASLEGVLDKIQLTFDDLERQEKRLLSLLKKRADEMDLKLQIQQTDETDESSKVRTLKEVEVIDKLQNETLKIVNDNLKNKIDLIKFYATSVLKKAEDGEAPVSESEKSDNGLSEKAMDDIRKHLKFTR